MGRWAAFAAAAPELAAFGEGRLAAAPAYLATVGGDGAPRVHPVTPVVGNGGLYVFMEPTSPKGHDIRRQGRYALHSGVPDTAGTGGEFSVRGRGVAVDDRATRAAVAAAATYEPVDRYVLFELFVDEARANGYGDVDMPDPRRWADTD